MSLYIFDKDGTLIRLKLKHLQQPVIRPEEQVLIEGVFEKLASLRAAGHKIAIASNQSAVPKGFVSLSEAEAMMENVVQKVGGVDAWRICPFDEDAPELLHGEPNPFRAENDCKKPKPGMLLELMRELGFGAEDTIMIGDSWHDRGAAKNAGVPYIRAKDFFKYS